MTHDEVLETFNYRCMDLIQRSGETRQSLSVKTGMSENTIRRIMNGRNKSLPYSYNLYRLARALSVTPAYLLGLE